MNLTLQSKLFKITFYFLVVLYSNRIYYVVEMNDDVQPRTVGLKCHDPCFHKQYMEEAWVTTFVTHCTSSQKSIDRSNFSKPP